MTYMNRLLLALCAALVTPVAAGAAAGGEAAPVTATALAGLDTYVEKAMAEWQVPGVAIAVVKDDRLVYARGFGVREAGKPGAVDADTVFAIGSATKAFTGAALAMLVDEKKIAWDGVVHGYMPGFVLNDPYATDHATVRDLLSHRTGFVSGSGWLWTGSGFDRREIIERLRLQTESAGFRNRFLYANEIYTAAGELVPAVTGASWDDFVSQRLFAPLGMTRSSTSVAALAGLANVASPHGMVDGRLVTFPYRQVDNVGGAGAINASARDMAQWVRLQIGDGVVDGKRLIGAAALAETRTGQSLPGAGRLVSPTSKFAEYGFGWILGDYRGRQVVEHMGGVDGMMCIVAMIPAEHLGVVVLTNMLPHQLPAAVALKVFDGFLGAGDTDWSATLKGEADKAKLEADRRKAVEASSAGPVTPALPPSRYVGAYVSDLYGRATVALDHGALVFSRPTATATLLHDRGNRFKARWTSASILSVFGETPLEFTTAAAGEVVALRLGTDAFRREPGTPAARAGTDAFLGTWHLDKGRSTIANDPGVKSKTFVFAPSADGVLITETLEMLSENGKQHVSRIPYAYGRSTPQDGPGIDALLVVKADSRTAYWTAQAKGQVVAQLQVVISPDDRQMTFRYLWNAADPTGKAFGDRYVYVRQ